MLRLVLLRHGNTFETGQKVVMVGAHDDPPLTARGREQALAAGQALNAHAFAAAYCGPLVRTRMHTAIVCDALATPPAVVVDDRLRELDYGAWSGKSDAEIAESFGAEPLRAWREDGVWPDAFVDSQAAAGARVQSFLHDVETRHKEDARVLVVTSQGVLRVLLSLVPGELERRAQTHTLPVATGNGGLLAWDGQALSIDAWNLAPNALAERL